MVKNTLSVGRIEEGFVLDHIQAGNSDGYSAEGVVYVWVTRR